MVVLTGLVAIAFSFVLVSAFPLHESIKGAFPSFFYCVDNVCFSEIR